MTGFRTDPLLPPIDSPDYARRVQELHVRLAQRVQAIESVLGTYDGKQTQNFQISPLTNDVRLGPTGVTVGATGGFPFAPVVAANMTGAPTAQTGFVPFVFDSGTTTSLTKQGFLLYNSGGTWFAIGGGSGTASPLTTKGDVWGYDSADNRIPIGTNGYVLTADSTQTLGLKWAPSSAGKSNAWQTLTISGSAAATDATSFINFNLTLNIASCALSNPTGMTDGDELTWKIKQDGTGSRVLTFGTKFRFFGGFHTVSTTASAIDMITGKYDAADDKIDCNMVLASV